MQCKVMIEVEKGTVGVDAWLLSKPCETKPTLLKHCRRFVNWLCRYAPSALLTSRATRIKSSTGIWIQTAPLLQRMACSHKMLNNTIKHVAVQANGWTRGWRRLQQMFYNRKFGSGSSWIKNGRSFAESPPPKRPPRLL